MIAIEPGFDSYACGTGLGSSATAPGLFLNAKPNFRILGDATSPDVGWAVAGGLLLGAVLGAVALGVVKRHQPSRRR